jgi:hypothetical protein
MRCPKNDVLPSPTFYGGHPAALISSGEFPVFACLTFSVDNDGAFALKMASMQFGMFWRVLLYSQWNSSTFVLRTN